MKYSHSDSSSKPFVKWAGGKSQILTEIRRKYPVELGVTITKYAEPFVGGGAVLFDVLNRYNLSAVYISDINRELIRTYIAIRDCIDELVGQLQMLEDEYLAADLNVRKSIYYSKRERFNSLKAINNNAVELAALFIFLNRTCFNGLYRVNNKGGFNVPMGNYKRPTICDEDNLRAASKTLENVIIVCADYKQSADFIDANTFAYFDPPYRPLSETSSFTAYAQNGFGDTEQSELARFIDTMSERGARITASNSDPKNTNTKDDFFDSLYKKHQISRITASRMINSAADRRGKINELLIANF